MAYEMLVQLAVTGGFGTDDDFDLQVRLEHDLAAALDGLAECGRGEIGDGYASVPLLGVTDPDAALAAVKGVLSRLGVSHRATVALEIRSELDPDDTDRQILWPLAPAAAQIA
jgi:hypothetical protein